MSLSTRLDKLVGLFRRGAQLERARSRGRLLDMERMYAAARPTEDAAGWLPLDRNVNDGCGQARLSSAPACASWCATSPISTGRCGCAPRWWWGTASGCKPATTGGKGFRNA